MAFCDKANELMHLDLEFEFVKATEIMKSCHDFHRCAWRGDNIQLFKDCTTVDGTREVHVSDQCGREWAVAVMCFTMRAFCNFL